MPGSYSSKSVFEPLQDRAGQSNSDKNDALNSLTPSRIRGSWPVRKLSSSLASLSQRPHLKKGSFAVRKKLRSGDSWNRRPRRFHNIRFPRPGDQDRWGKLQGSTARRNRDGGLTLEAPTDEDVRRKTRPGPPTRSRRGADMPSVPEGIAAVFVHQSARGRPLALEEASRTSWSVLPHHHQCSHPRRSQREALFVRRKSAPPSSSVPVPASLPRTPPPGADTARSGARGRGACLPGEGRPHGRCPGG